MGMIGRGLKSSSSTGASEGWTTLREVVSKLLSAVDAAGAAVGTGDRAAAALPVAVVAVAAAAAEAEMFAGGAGADGKDASSSFHLLLLEDEPLLCCHLF